MSIGFKCIGKGSRIGTGLQVQSRDDSALTMADQDDSLSSRLLLYVGDLIRQRGNALSAVSERLLTRVVAACI